VAGVRLGAAAILGAKLYFLAAGYALVIGLTNLLGVEQFGVYSVLFAVVSLLNMVLINGTLQTVSRFIASRPDQRGGVRRRAFLYQAVFLAVALGAVLFFADGIATVFMDDPKYAPLLRLAMLITGIYGFYAINIGYLNGSQQFVKQAFLDTTFATLKVGLMLGLTYAGYSIEGAVVGFAGAAAVGLVLSFFIAGFDFGGPAADIRPTAFASFAVSVMGVALLLNGLLQVDLLMLQNLSEASVKDTNSGLYGAAQQIARIPYYIMVTASLVLFPVIAALHGETEESRERRADAVSRAFTGIFAIVAGMAAVTIPISERVLLVLYKVDYAPAAPALGWLIGGIVLVTMLNVSVSMISGGGRPGVSAALLTTGLVTQAGAAWVLIPRAGIVGAGQATTLAAAVALLASAVWLWRSFGLRVSMRVPVVVGASVAAIAALAVGFGAVAPASKILTLLFCAFAFATYVGLLLLGGVLLGAPHARTRVLLVTKPIAPPFNDGSKVLARGLLDHLDRTRVSALTTKAGRRALMADLGEDQLPELAAVYGAGGTFGGRLVENLRVFLFLLATRFTYKRIHFFFAPNKMTCRAIRMLRLLSPGVPFVQTIQSRPRSYDDAGELIFGDVVTAGSNDTAKRMQDAAGVEVTVVRPGIEPVTDAAERDDALAALDLPQGDRHVLFAGDIDEGGALDHLATLVPALLEARDDVVFHFSVRTKRADTKARADAFFEQHLRRFGDRARMWVDHAPFAQLLDAQDAMVFCAEDLYTKVDAPLVVLETIARGKPCFLLRRAPLDEIPPAALADKMLADDAAQLAERVVAWLDDPATVPAGALKAHIDENFSLARMAAQYEELHVRAA
jgi:phosphatidylinositol alpha-1,6-mannosyltransferase